MVVVGRILPSGEPFDKVLWKALNDKVPKLVATPADKHILLLEDGGTAIGFVKVTEGIDENVKDLSDLKKVNDVNIGDSFKWKRRVDNKRHTNGCQREPPSKQMGRKSLLLRH